MRYYTLGIIPLAIQYEIVDGFTGMGQVKYALPLSLFRKAIYLLCVYIIPCYYEIEYIFYCESVSDVVPTIVSCIVYFTCLDKVIKNGCKATVEE